MAKGFKVSMEEWSIQLKTRPEGVYVYHKGKEKKKIPVDKFEKNGMILFPKAFYNKIVGSIRHSNTYDRFIDKLYEYLDGEQS